MRRTIAALALLVVGAACRESALASGDKDETKALCAAAHGVPRVLLAYHHQRVGRVRAMAELDEVRETINEHAVGKYAAHLRDLAASIRVFEIVTKSRGDTGDAYRDLRALRESLPGCPR